MTKAQKQAQRFFCGFIKSLYKAPEWRNRVRLTLKVVINTQCLSKQHSNLKLTS